MIKLPEQARKETGHFYLAPYIGKGTYGDPFRCYTGSSQQKHKGIDLRPHGRSVDGYCFLWTPSLISDARVKKLGEHRLEKPSLRVRRLLENSLGLASDTLPPDKPLGEALYTLLKTPPRGASWRAVQPDKKRGRSQVILGPPGNEVLFSEKAHFAPSTQNYTEDFVAIDDWTVVTGDFAVSLGRLRCGEGGTGEIAIRYDSAMDTTDHDVMTEYHTHINTASWGVTARMNAASEMTYYAASQRCNSNDMELNYLDNGSFNLLGTRDSQTEADGDQIKIEVSGSTITGFYNDGGAGFVQFEQQTNSSISSTTRVGVRAYSAVNSYYVDLELWAANDLASAQSALPLLNAYYHG